MRGLVMLVLIGALNAGCATPTGAPDPVVGTAHAEAPVAPQTAQAPGSSLDDATTDTPPPAGSARTPSMFARIGRGLKCAGKGAVTGVAIPAAMTPYTAGASIYLIPITVPVGLIVGLKEGLVGPVRASGDTCS